MTIDEASPVTLTSRPTYREVIRRLSSAQKGAKGAPAYSRFVNRRLGRYLAAGAYLLGMSPNQVTAVSALFSALALVLLATLSPSALLGVLVALGLLLGYALDSADGQLARLRGMSSRAGEWLDHMIDCTKISSMHLVVLISLYRFGHLGSAGYLLIPLGFCVVNAVLFFGMTLNDQLRRGHAAATGIPLRAAPAPSTLRSLAVIPTDYGLVCAVFLLLGWQTGFRVGYALLFLGHAGFLVLASVKWFRDMKALDAVAAPVR
jgi:phosphatidylglycerophosphate synthase